MFSLNCTILPIILILFAQTFLTVIAKNDTLKNGRTYFVQLKNVGDGETMYRSPWRKNLSSKYSKSIDEYEIVGRLVQSVSIFNIKYKEYYYTTPKYHTPGGRR